MYYNVKFPFSDQAFPGLREHLNTDIGRELQDRRFLHSGCQDMWGEFSILNTVNINTVDEPKYASEELDLGHF